MQLEWRRVPSFVGVYEYYVQVGGKQFRFQRCTYQVLKYLHEERKILFHGHEVQSVVDLAA